MFEGRSACWVERSRYADKQFRGCEPHSHSTQSLHLLYRGRPGLGDRMAAAPVQLGAAMSGKRRPFLRSRRCGDSFSEPLDLLGDLCRVPTSYARRRTVPLRPVGSPGDGCLIASCSERSAACTLHCGTAWDRNARSTARPHLRVGKSLPHGSFRASHGRTVRAGIE